MKKAVIHYQVFSFHIKQQYRLFDAIDFIDKSPDPFPSVLRAETSIVVYQQAELPDWAAGIVKHIQLLARTKHPS